MPRKKVVQSEEEIRQKRADALKKAREALAAKRAEAEAQQEPPKPSPDDIIEEKLKADRKAEIEAQQKAVEQKKVEVAEKERVEEEAKGKEAQRLQRVGKLLSGVQWLEVPKAILDTHGLSHFQNVQGERDKETIAAFLNLLDAGYSVKSVSSINNNYIFFFER